MIAHAERNADDSAPAWCHQVLPRFEARLAEIGFECLRDDDLWRQLRKQVNQAVLECAVSVGDLSPLAVRRRPAPLRVVQGPCDIPVVDVLAASEVLVDVVFDLLLPELYERRDGVALLGRATRSLNGSILTCSRTLLATHEVGMAGQSRQLHAADRRQVSRDLHDWVGNAISLADRHLDMHELLTQRGLSGGEDRLGMARHAIHEAMDSTRAIISGLRVHAPVDSIADALRAYAQSAAPDDLFVQIASSGDEALLTAEVRCELYVVLRECARNVFRHSQARRFDVVITVDATRIVVIAEDNGIGFDVDDPALRRHGLDSMSERIEMLGGTWRIMSALGAGTRVEFTAPLGVDLRLRGSTR